MSEKLGKTLLIYFMKQIKNSFRISIIAHRHSSNSPGVKCILFTSVDLSTPMMLTEKTKTWKNCSWMASSPYDVSWIQLPEHFAVFSLSCKHWIFKANGKSIAPVKITNKILKGILVVVFTVLAQPRKSWSGQVRDYEHRRWELQAPKARASRGVWGHAPLENFENATPQKHDLQRFQAKSIIILLQCTAKNRP